ncbi:MAG: FMN-binding glutamate synthase family protein [Parvularculaceae bacterium]
MDILAAFTMTALDLLSGLFVFIIGFGILILIYMYFVDANQSRDAIRHNYPVIGRFRNLFLRLGEFFRQYFFALDREEMPFNRAQRDWIYKSAKGGDNTAPFGSTLSLSPVGTPIFVNCAFPTLKKDAEEPPAVVFGPNTEHPYSASSIINISGMSYGALSRPAIRALSRGAKRAKCWLNTGEGGLSAYHLEGGCDIVFQIGTAKYGVRNEKGEFCEQRLAEIAGRENVKMIELKLSQGAKPGKGGLLPGAKVTREIAAIRGIPVGKDSISPNRHLEADTCEQLLDFIDRIRTIARKPVGVKTALGAYGWLEDLCDEINRRGPDSAPDYIAIDGGEGGTGAAPMPLMDNVGLSIREALPTAIDIITAKGLRDRIKILCAGKMVTPADVAWAYCAGADVVMSARGFMFAIGCIQAMRCNTNNCPTGITTHKKRLQEGLDPLSKAENVSNFVEKMRYGVGLIAHSCGVKHPRALRRHHVRIMQEDGRSAPLDKLYPPAGPF